MSLDKGSDPFAQKFLDLVSCIEEKKKNLDMDTTLWFQSVLEKCSLMEYVNYDLGFTVKQAIVTSPNAYGTVKYAYSSFFLKKDLHNTFFII